MSNQLVVIGSGLVGLATAYQYLQKHPGHSVTVLEKEEKVAQHQSSHNSGVLHTGIYYKPGSLKAKNCSHGKKLLQDFCTQHQVPFKICGKLIIATETSELPNLQMIYERGIANGVSCELVEPARIKEIEPHVAGIKGIWVKDAGVVDFPAVADAFVTQISRLGGRVVFNSEVRSIQESETEAIIRTSSGKEFATQRYVNAAGLHCDRILGLTGVVSPGKIVPFRGEYYILKPEFDSLCKALIYPVPNPNFPFLGVHFTRGVHGEVECGPNAVLALAREGYRWGNIQPWDLLESLTYSGFLKVAKKYWREGWDEIKRSLSKELFVRALQRLVPEIQSHQLIPGPSGVRAQSITADGKLVDDFLLHSSKRGIHVLNAPSPAATSCLSIGEHLVAEISS